MSGSYFYSLEIKNTALILRSTPTFLEEIKGTGEPYIRFQVSESKFTRYLDEVLDKRREKKKGRKSKVPGTSHMDGAPALFITHT